MAPRRPLKKHAPAVLLGKLASSDPETRWRAARDLATHGDRSTIAPLEALALADQDSFQREGAYVDSTEYPAIAALEALTALHARHPPADADLARVRACLADLTVAPGRAEPLGATLGAAAVAMAAPLLAHADPAIRLRATNVTARARGDRANHSLWALDEEVRLAATQQDAYRPGLYRDALERFPAEPSVRVRRGICDLWLRHRARMGGWLRSFELADQLVDPDPAIHTRIAQHVLDTARARTPTSTTWIDDPGGLRPIRARLAALLAGALPPPSVPLLREVLALIDATLAPFGDPGPRAP